MDVKIGTGKVRATIQLQGAMTTAVFEAGTDAEFSPSYTATWEGFPEAPILDRLRGDFACLPFGAAPRSDGSTIDLTRVPLGVEVDEIVLIAGPKEPRIVLVNEAEGYRVAVEWDPKYLQNAMLWISNRGRKGLPWGGTNLCLGVEPITSAFDFGQGVSANETPLRKAGYSTAIDFEAGRTYEVRHRIAGEGIG